MRTMGGLFYSHGSSAFFAWKRHDFVRVGGTTNRPAFRQFHRHSGGATAVEFAIIAPVLIALIIALLQTGLVYLSDAALEVATEKSSRLVMTGTVQGQAQNQQQFLATVCSKLPTILKCSRLMVDAQVYATFSSANTSSPTIKYNADGTVANNWSYNVGGAGDIVVMRVLYLMPVVGGPLNFTLANAGNGNHLCMATAVFKNEPYQ